MSDTPISQQLRRTFFVGLNTGYVQDAAPDDRMIAFYERRSSPLLACAIVGNVVIPDGYGSNPVSPKISGDLRWKDLASVIASRGTMPGIQLTTAWEGYAGATSFHPKDWSKTIAKSRLISAAITPSRLQGLFARLREATELAADANFRHVQLHAAHGYLFSLLLDERLYEGAADCFAFVSQWAVESRRAGLETSVRMSLKTGDPTFDCDGAAAFQDTVSELPVDLVDVSSGYYNIDKRLIYPSVDEVLQQRREETGRLAARHPQSQFILSGRASEIINSFPMNVHLGLCRDLLANPRFLFERSRGCRNSGKCHYHSRGAESISCPRWAA